MDPSVLTLLPIILLIVTAVFLIGLRYFAPTFRYAWLIASSGTLLCWASQLWLYTQIPSGYLLLSWSPDTLFHSSPTILLDSISWPFSMALCSLCLAILLTATARHPQDINPLAWSGYLIITAAGLLSVQSANLVSLLLTWVIIDLVEFYVLFSTGNDSDTINRTVLTFSIRVLGTILVLFASVQNPATWFSFDFFSDSTQNGVFFLLGVGLRVGILPLHLPFRGEPLQRRGMGTILRLVTAASCLIALARMPSGVVDSQYAAILLFLCALAAFSNALFWATAKDELSGRTFWITALGVLAIVNVIRGNPAGVLAWGITLILSGGFLFLYSTRSLRVAYLPTLAAWCLTGLPYSPSAGGWIGLVGGPATWVNIFYFATHALLLLGTVRHSIRVVEPLDEMERWVQLMYPLGMTILAITHLVLGMVGWQSSWTPGVWWASLISFGAAIAAGYLYYRFQGSQPAPVPGVTQTWWQDSLNMGYQRLATILSLTWLFRFLTNFYRWIERLVNLMTTILEGDGGILWAFVLLMLLLTILQTRGIL